MLETAQNLIGSVFLYSAAYFFMISIPLMWIAVRFAEGSRRMFALSLIFGLPGWLFPLMLVIMFFAAAVMWIVKAALAIILAFALVFGR